MKIFTRIMLVLALAAGLFAQPARSQTDQPSKKDSSQPHELVQDSFYKLSFAIYELDDGKRSNQREYMMIAKTNSPGGGSIRVSTRVPVYTEEKKMQYVDVGLNLRCPVKELGANKLQVECDMEISSFIKPDQSGTSINAMAAAPILRSTRTSSWAVATLGKPVILATVDDINSAKRLQIEFTATKVE